MGMMSNQPRLRVDCSVEPTRTKQSFKDECDINKIMAKYRKGQVVTHLARGTPRFADVSELTDYRSAIHAVRDGDRFFEGLPADVREAFRNDPAEFVDAMTSGGMTDERLAELGVKLYDDDPSNDGELEEAVAASKRASKSSKGASEDPGSPEPEKGQTSP